MTTALHPRFPLTGAQVGLLALVVGGALLLPESLKFKVDFLGFGVCHQIHSHSLMIGGHQLPLCARCTGIYLGALITVCLLAVLRRRAAALPDLNTAPTLGIMFALMVLDGINSTLQALPGATPLYETVNWMRLGTGLLAGMALMFVIYPLFNQSFWRTERLARERTLDDLSDLWIYLGVAAIVGALLYSLDRDAQIAEWAYWLAALASLAGLLALLGMTNILIVSSLRRSAGTIATGAAALTPLLLVLILALVELSLLGGLRASLTPLLATGVTTDLPLVPGLP
jgi:uncharacterized membrane protein